MRGLNIFGGSGGSETVAGSSRRKGLLFIGAAILFGLLAMALVIGVGWQMAPNVPALQAKENIAAGDPLTRDMFEEVKLAESNLPPGMVDPDMEFLGVISSRPLNKGDVLRDVDLIGLEGDVSSLFSARLVALEGEDLRAMEVPVGNIEGLVVGMGYNDLIDIIAVFEVENFEDGTVETMSQTILEAVPVIGLRTVSENGDDSMIQEGSPILVIAVTKEESERLALYQEASVLHASIRAFGTERPLKHPADGIMGEEADESSLPSDEETDDNNDYDYPDRMLLQDDELDDDYDYDYYYDEFEADWD